MKLSLGNDLEFWIRISKLNDKPNTGVIYDVDRARIEEAAMRQSNYRSLFDRKQITTITQTASVR